VRGYTTRSKHLDHPLPARHFVESIALW
jgi:hypothetical protein